MLKGIHPLLSPELLALLARMGHGDTIAVVDRNFPAYTTNDVVIRADGVGTTAIAEAVFSLLPIDTFTDTPVGRMRVVDDPDLVPAVQREFLDAARAAEGREIGVEPIERFEFYRRARDAAGVVATGEARGYGCFLVTKGVITA